jgi:cyclopropane fatty-acyl-phospholipid synthase-like methyltransferase
VGSVQDLYRDSGLLDRLRMRGRLAICPFEPLLEEIKPGAHMLDIGCGHGLLLCRAVLERQVDGIGWDVNTHAIAIAHLMAARLARSLETTHRPGRLRFSLSGDSAAWPTDTFDVVTMIDVLHHIPRDQQEVFLRRAAARVAPGGTFIYKDIAGPPAWMAGMNRFHDLIVARQWVHYFPMCQVVQTLEAMGLELRKRAAIRTMPEVIEIFGSKRSNCSIRRISLDPGLGPTINSYSVITEILA